MVGALSHLEIGLRWKDNYHGTTTKLEEDTGTARKIKQKRMKNENEMNMMKKREREEKEKKS